MRYRAHLPALLVSLLITAACKRSTNGQTLDGQTGSLLLQSRAFTQGGTIPKQFTCDGRSISPSLSWSSPPARTQSLALIVNDPDAPSGNFTHWVLYNLPPQTRTLTEGLPAKDQLPDGSQQGMNDNDSTGYWGPCPPGGSPHRYVFTLYALDTRLTLPQVPDAKHLTAAMKGHVLASGQLMAHYVR
jgi:Raf kinase inhibitor-like YbhB/YbcL family protein